MPDDNDKPWYKTPAAWAGAIIAASVLGYYLKKYMGEKRTERVAQSKQLDMIESELSKMGGGTVVIGD
jgi:uncharacterized membrane protein YdjX (TVP38/TMEM64 family)